MEFYANLHTHSTHSDGKWTPRELANVAYREGYRALSVTDHDTVSGNAEAADECKKLGMEYLFGCEFTVKEPYAFHMVAFEFDPNEPEMRAYLDALSRRATEETRIITQRAIDAGAILGITWDEVLTLNEGITWICNDHVFRAMKIKGLVRDEEYDEWFRVNFRDQRRGVAKELVAAGFRYKTAKELIDLIHRAGGLAVFAHPTHLIPQTPLLIEAGIDGIEVWHANQTQPVAEQAFRYGMQYRLYLSGGSDHCGLCSGLYNTFPSEEELKKSKCLIPECCCGVPRVYFDEIKTRTKCRPV